MRKSNLRATAAWQALALLGAGAIAGPAFAQETTAPPSSETAPASEEQPTLEAEAQRDSDDAIVVTGSRLVRPELDAPSPVTTVDSEAFDLTGTVTVETLLNELPQIIPGNTRVSNNQGGETFSTLDLRGLGPQRTLILVDGERVPASSTSGVVDIGTLPAGLIERVDVVTGGASAVYGSDAMAGVVNFILKDNYEGMEVTGQYGISDHGDAGEFNIQGLVGGNFGDDRGNLTFFTSYYTRDAVGQGDRDITRNQGVVFYDYETFELSYASHLEAPGPDRGLWNLSASGTNPWGTISSPGNAFQNLSTNPLTPNFASADTDCNPATAGVPVNGGSLSFNDDGELAPNFSFGFTPTHLCAFADRSTGSSMFNYNPLNLLVTPYTRWNMAMTGRYDISDAIRLKIVANYTDSEQIVNLAPTPATGLRVDPTLNPFIREGVADDPLTIGIDETVFGACGVGVSCHPDLLAALESRADPDGLFTINRRTVETGPRIGTYDSKTATLRGTLSGPLAHGFNWDATLSYGRTDGVESLENNINRAAMQQGLDGCSTTSGLLPNCVPVDLFGAGTITDSMINFIAADTKETRFFDQARIAGNITGNIVDLPAGPVGIAIGAEARTDRGDVKVDDLQRTGNIIGFNATQDQKGKVNVKELYGEVRIPILADLPFVHEFSVEAGARYSDYSSVGGLFNWKLGAQFAPVDWLKFRAIFNKAARAPSIVELFQGGDQGFVTVRDPCNDTALRTAEQLAICQAQAPLADFGNGFTQTNPQLQVFAFGNPGLTEETAKTYTIGAVLTPNLGLGRFSATVDYYNVKIRDIISTFGAGFFLGACYAQGQTDPFTDECNRVVRDPLTGQVTSIDTTVLNSGSFQAKGIDGQVNYSVPLADLGLGVPGRIRFQEILSWTDSINFDGYEAAGMAFAGIGGSFPEWKSTMTVAYDSDDFTGQLRWNYLSEVEEDEGLGEVELPSGQIANRNPTRDALSYFDLSLRKSIGNNFELTGIVQNLFNAKAKRTPAGLADQGGVDTTWYNPVILGRYFRIQGKVKF